MKKWNMFDHKIELISAPAVRDFFNQNKMVADKKKCQLGSFWQLRLSIGFS